MWTKICLGGAGKLIRENPKTKGGEPPRSEYTDVTQPKAGSRSALIGILRGILAFCVCVLLLGGLGIGALYFLLQGKTGEASAVSERIRAELQTAVGENFEIDLGDTHADLSDIGSVQLTSENILITDKQSRDLLVKIEELKVGVSLLEAISGKRSFDRIFIEGVTIDTNALGQSADLFLPRYLDEPLDTAGALFAQINTAFKDQDFSAVKISNVTIDGPLLGRRHSSPVLVSQIDIEPTNNNGFSLTADISTELSQIDIQSSYGEVSADEFDAGFEFEASGINMMEWLHHPSSVKGYLASDGELSVAGILRFDSSNNALDPSIALTASPSSLRIGSNALTNLNAAEINARLILDRNQIELDPSGISVGGFTATLVGGIKPEDGYDGYYGPLRYDLIVKHGVNIVPGQSEEPIPAAFKFAGVFDHSIKELSFERFVMTTEKGLISGSGKLGLTDASPSIIATANTEGISVAALQQFWPFFVADGAREWVKDHVSSGWIENGTLSADIPAGVILNLEKGKSITNEQYQVDLKVSDFGFRPFGDLPDISDAEGTVTLKGMSVSGKLTSGRVVVGSQKPITVDSGNFVMNDFSAEPRIAEAAVELTGDVNVIAGVSDREPLRVMQRMKVAAKQFSGKAHANIAAKFPVGQGVQYEDVEWNVLLDLKNGKSTKKLAERSLSNADLLIDANRYGAKVTGTMNVDGMLARVDMVEPIGKSGKVTRKRQLVATLDEKARKKLGINLAPVVNGPVDVRLVEQGGVEKYSLDFTETKLDLPWVGWSKGSGISAKGSFVLEELKNGARLKDFQLSGAGFGATGTLVVDKQGLAFADLSKLKLNDEDDFRLKLERKAKVYNINASGLNFDARGILNTLIHKGGFANAQGGRSVSLVADIAKVKGFGNRIVRNAILLYDSVGGQLKRLDMKASGSKGRQYAVQAQRNGNDTLFNIETNDAGTSLAFTDIYTRMEGGVLEARLIQGGSGPYVGRVRIKDFFVVNEPRLKSISSSARKQIQTEGGQRARIEPDTEDKKVRFLFADSKIERGQGTFKVSDTIIRSTNVGIAMDGTVYDRNDRMSLTGTFMPANSVNLAVSNIPLLGQLFADGRKNALIGITYKLEGPRKNPELRINPLSVVAPGVFNKVFEFK